jgi:preprotein translocase subunit SecG
VLGLKIAFGLVHLLLCLALIGVIMLQHRKSGGFQGIFGGGTQADMGGGQWQRLSALSKVTVGLLGLFMAMSLVLVLLTYK